ncbi:MAG: toll/interleukin-1 receptor domain-containing protein [Leptolyngbya sp. SIO3F4]|nr:toll/interleukin-1 receptor domain-containing protein [Leptolyngbya sp. SIO3F4]
MTKDFFVSYNSANRAWAEWIAWVLEENGYSVIIQAWDFMAGGNFILEMQRATTEAERTVMVLSDDYLKALYTQPEWAAAFKLDPTSANRKLLPIRVAPCKPTGMLAPLIYIDLVDQSEAKAEELILAALQDRAKPKVRPAFPKEGDTAKRSTPVMFPGTVEEASKQPVGQGEKEATTQLTPGEQLKLQDRKDKLAKLHKRLEKIDRKIDEGVDFEEEEKLETRKNNIFQEIDEISKEIQALEQRNG